MTKKKCCKKTKGCTKQTCSQSKKKVEDKPGILSRFLKFLFPRD